MTHPNPPAKPNATIEAAASGAAETRAATGRAGRKAPRRVTAAAGTPASAQSSVSAILVIDANGMMVPATATARVELPTQTQDTSDAENSPAAVAAPLEVAKSEGAKSEVAKSEPVEPQAAVKATFPAPVSLADSPGEPEPELKPELEPVPELKPEPAPSEPSPSNVTTNESVSPGTTAAVAAAVAPVSLSRRERRLAEQQKVDGTTAATVAMTALDSTVLDNSVSETIDPESSATQEEPAHNAGLGSSAKQPRKRNRFVAFLRGLFFLVVISALVVAMGTVLSGPDVNAGDQSQTQTQRQVAWETTTKLQSEALRLAEASRTPEVQKALSTTAAHLGLQASALSDGLPTATATTTSTTTTPGLAAAPVSLSITGLVQELSVNAETLLGNAFTAEHAMGRVFASVGTSQLLQSAELASAAGTTVPASRFVPALVDFPAVSGPSCTSTLEPRPGATVDSALRAAAAAEQKAVYAYQVASTRFAEPQFSKATALLARHRQKLELLNAELRLRCLPLAAPTAGFTLDSTFTTLPKQALSILEVQLSTIYGELAALSTAPGADRSPNTAESAAPVSAATESTSEATQDPLNGSLLRELAVLWLLDSTQAHTSWGGSVEALPGIAPEPVISLAPAG